MTRDRTETAGSAAIERRLQPLVGEFMWHSLTVDPRIADESAAHLAAVLRVAEAYPVPEARPRLLEVGAYAHSTGYMLADRHGFDVTLLDISSSALRHGRDLVLQEPVAGAMTGRPRLVAADFHDLPFEDLAFDYVVVRSAVHHTWHWQVVVRELLRVLNCGGVLFLENEPVERACCSYSFRTNRPDSFTAFERLLDEQSALRTFAEPYYGSRPETLFGMIENQRIRIDELLDLVRSEATLEEVHVAPEYNMTSLEHRWLEESGRPVGELSELVAGDLLRVREAAESHFGARERGVGFRLPGEDEIRRLAADTAGALTTRRHDFESQEGRLHLAALFGAGTALVARKNGQRAAPSSGALRSSFREQDGVVQAFDASIAELLSEGSSELPSLTSSPWEEVVGAFPEDHWQRADHGVLRLLQMRSDEATIRLPASHSERLLLVRYGTGQPEDPDDEGTEIVWTLGDLEVDRQRSWFSETYLCRVRLPATANGESLRVRRTASSTSSAAAILIHQVCLLPLQAPGRAVTEATQAPADTTSSSPSTSADSATPDSVT